MNDSKFTLSAAAVVMFPATLNGAMGAHALQPMLLQSGREGTWETAVLYQLVHGIALLVAGVWLHTAENAKRPPALFLAAMFWLGGIVLFSGSLYILSLGGPTWVGPITPVGGVCFLSGWLVLAIGVLRMKSRLDTR